MKNTIKAFDNGGISWDRYTIVVDNRDVFGMSKNANSPQGFDQWLGSLHELPLVIESVEGKFNRAIGQQIPLQKLPLVVRQAIAERMA